MAIYKNGKTLKACKGDYGPVNLYLGETKIAGWRTAQQQGKDLAFAGTYKDRIGGLTVYGKSLQNRTVQGKNIVDKERLKNPESWQPGNSYHYVPLKVKSGASYAMSMSANHSAGKGFYLNLDTRPGAGGSGTNICWLAHPSETAGQSRYKFTTAADTVYFNIFPKPTEESLAELFEQVVINLQIEEGTEYTGYQPFVPNSPSPEYPAEISGIEGATVASMGKNLCQWDGQPVKYMGHQSIMTLWTVAVQPRAMSFSAWIDNSGCSMPRRIRVNGYDKSLSKVYSSVNGNDILPGEQGISRVENVTNHLRNENIKYLVMLTGGDYDTEKNQEYSYIRNPQAEARPECTSYQPYMRTQASYGGTLRALPVSGDNYTCVDVEGTKWIADTVELSEGSVYHVQRVNKIAANCIGIYRKFDNVIRFNGSVTWNIAGIADSALLCNRLERKSNYWLHDGECIFWHDGDWTTNYYYSLNKSRLGANDTDTDAQIMEKLNAWLAEHSLTLQYILQTPVRTDITDTEAGQAFLSLKTTAKYTRITGPELEATVKVEE